MPLNVVVQNLQVTLTEYSAKIHEQSKVREYGTNGAFKTRHMSSCDYLATIARQHSARKHKEFFLAISMFPN